MKSVIVLSLVLIIAVLMYVTLTRQAGPVPYEPFTNVSAPAAPATPKPVTVADLDTFKKSLKEELLNSLKFDTAIRGCNGSGAAQSTPATEQGAEYIRKDSIPCWGCKL